MTPYLNETEQCPLTESALIQAKADQEELNKNVAFQNWLAFVGSAAFVVCSSVFSFPGGILSVLPAAAFFLVFWLHNSSKYGWQDYTPIPQSRHEEAYNLFSATPEGLQYLERIREMGREVTGFDLDVARCWNRDVESREEEKDQQLRNEAATQKLYGPAAVPPVKQPLAKDCPDVASGR